MTSIAILEAVNTSYVPFNGHQIITAMAAGVAYVAMKPIVENLGMSWSTQQTKLMKQLQKFNCVHMNMVAADGKLRKLLCLPLKKLNGWLFSINPEKVRADIRDKLIQYQEECFTVLHDYWTKGKAENARKKTSVDDRTPLRDAVNMLVSKKHLMYPEAYAMIHQRFNVESIEELDASQIPQAVEYIHRVVLEGEFIGKQEELPSKKLNIPDITMEWWYSNNFPMRVGNLERYPGHKVWHDLTLTPPMMYGEDTKSPALFLIEILERMGFDMVAPRIEVETMRIMLGKGKRQIRVVGDGRVKYLLSL
ncbi:antirepressor protein Ant [Salmonella enterica subsp. enterica serovar Manchester]|uniref:phage antirepressor N-terminal domain-containing protein n=2 Tax=Salmonella enterica TaxID=28901 RepID=UPI00107DC586|nr:phage antirepressor N-terminal domain-containing protein [Salmonella enterica]EAB5958554.1 antirepressor protein Ant [Salmonella enterica subsp. enterica serovar Manchester]ECB6928815.1 antirepressor protein Ant [Salmonella enterica subsp. enterica serovar Manchester]EGZ4459634.1 antirepressor protein Ant [Salmonella enterica subsp. enterica serovar Manchester]WFQ04769.1 phage antirepressor N-terminal domain-containing protein [Salmonella enterica subsp. enterica]WFQ07825.1 phage antirepres